MVFAFAAAIGGTALAIAGGGFTRMVWAFFAVVMLAHGLANARRLTRTRSH